MKQVTHTQRDGRIVVREVPPPMTRPGGALVRTAFSVISAGTERTKVDVARKSLLGKAMSRPDQVRAVIESARQLGVAATYQKVVTRMDALSPLGYSSAGVVVEVGRNTLGLRPGDRVACGGATAAHAEMVFVPQNLCVPVPDGVALDEAAFATIGAIALQGVRQSEAVLGETVGVIGLGLVGLITMQLLRAAGCRVVGIDIDAERSRLGESFGAEIVFHPDSADAERLTRQVTATGLDKVIITAATQSRQPIELAGRLARDRAIVVIVGAVPIDVPRSPYYEKELSVRLSRSYGPGRYDPQYEDQGHDYPIGYVRWTEGRNMSAFLDLLAQGKLDAKTLITRRFAITDAEAAYTHLESGTAATTLGVLLEHGTAQEREHSNRPVEVMAPRPVTDGIGVGLIGAGNFAQATLLPHLSRNPKVRLRAVMTPGGLTAVAAADRAGFEICCGDPAGVFADPDVGLVVIASRHGSHAQLAAAAIGSSKAVFVEKPLAVTPAQQQEVIAAWEASVRAGGSPFLMVGFNRRFQPLVVRLREFVGEMREPMLLHYRVNAGYIPPQHWTQDAEDGGGRVVGEVCHFVDLLIHLVGQRPVEVMAHATPDSGRYSRDNLSALIRFADGSAATLLYAANGDRGLEKERVEVFGGGRAAVLDDFRKLTLSAGGKRRTATSRPDKGHRDEMAALVDALTNGKPSPVPFEQAVLSMDTTYAIEASLDTGLPVPLPA